MQPDLHDKLFTIIRLVMKSSEIIPDGFSLSAEDADQLLAFGVRQSILPIIHTGIKKLHLPELKDTLAKYDNKVNRCHYDYSIRVDSLNKLSQVLDDAQIQFIPLKGAVIQDLYPEPWMRTSSDIDILVHEDDLNRSIKEIEKKTKYRFTGYRGFHDVSLVSDKMHLELHFSIRERIDKVDPVLSRVWEYTTHDGDSSKMVLTTEYLIFYILSHMSHHMMRGGLGIRPFVDLWLLTTKTKYDIDKLTILLEEAQINKFYDKSLELLDYWMNDSTPTELIIKMDNYCMSGGALGNAKNEVLSYLREKRGCKYYIHRLFADRSYLEDQYPELKEKPNKLLLYQVKRWSRLKNKRKRNQILNEVKGAKKAKDIEIVENDEFLKAIGL